MAASAQNFRGSLAGVVQDSSGKRVPSATVVVQSAGAQSIRRETRSDGSGEFRVEELLPGTYTLTVTAPGFAAAKRDVSIAVTTSLTATVTLKPAGQLQTVIVQGEASSIATRPVDPANTVQGGVISEQDLKILPLASRSFANISGAGHGAGGALRSHQGANHRGGRGGELRAE